MLRRFFLITMLIGLSTIVFSEETNPPTAGKGTLKGFVFDTNVKQPLEYATVSMFSMREGKVVNGTVTDATGFFKVKDVDFGMYKVTVSFIGYKPKTIEKVMVRPKENMVDLGKINLESATETIDEAVVVADRPTLTYKIDKKVINVSQQHTSASGTAVEILENIPSITVDIEGNVSLRGSSSFTVLIDSKPTVLDPSDALSQIPASAIENIEVITNPSAKYDPEGTSGIINIITKKNKLQGVSGVVNLNGGTQERYGGDFLFNWRKERMNIFLGADFNNSNRLGNMDIENRTYQNDTTSYIFSNGEFERGRTTTSVRGGFDLTLNPRNSLSFEARVGDWSMNGGSETRYNEYTNPVTTNNFYNSIEDSERGGMYYNFSLNYTKKFMRKDHQIYALINYNGRDFDEESENELTDDSGNLISGQKTAETGPRSSYKFQVDYTLPFNEKSKFEAGVQGTLSGYDEGSEMYAYNPASLVYEFMPDFDYDVTREKDIYSVYSIYSGEIGRLGYQGGLRGEYTYRDIVLNTTGESFTIDRFDLFPTVHLSYNTAKENQWMVNYSRRIRRPRGYYLQPFLTYTDAYNVRIGNPDIKPQYIDSYELSHLIKFGRNTLSLDAYYRITDNKIERVRTVYEDNVFLSTFENVGKDYSLGIEMMLGLDVQKWWHVDLMGNFYDYKVEGEFNGKDFSESSFNWNSRLNNTFRLGKTTRVQLNGMYNSPTVSAQGDRDGFLMANLAVRQSFYKNKLAATLQVRDLFQTMKHSATLSDDDFYSSYEYIPEWPMVSLTLTYKINNYKPSRKNRSQDGNDDMGGDEVF